MNVVAVLQQLNLLAESDAAQRALARAGVTSTEDMQRLRMEAFRRGVLPMELHDRIQAHRREIEAAWLDVIEDANEEAKIVASRASAGRRGRASYEYAIGMVRQERRALNRWRKVIAPKIEDLTITVKDLSRWRGALNKTIAGFTEELVRDIIAMDRVVFKAVVGVKTVDQAARQVLRALRRMKKAFHAEAAVTGGDWREWGTPAYPTNYPGTVTPVPFVGEFVAALNIAIDDLERHLDDGQAGRAHVSHPFLCYGAPECVADVRLLHLPGMASKIAKDDYPVFGITVRRLTKAIGDFRRAQEQAGLIDR